MVEIELRHEDAKLPVRASEGAGAVDLCAIEGGHVARGCRALVKTGLAMAIPDGYLGFVVPRSGLALKHGITVLNAPGLVDSDYRGEVGVILQNLGNETFAWQAGERVAQLAVLPCMCGDPVEVPALDSTARGAGGFGSTGR